MTDTHRDTQPVTAIHRKQYLACVLLALLALSPMLVLPWLNTSVAVNGADELDALLAASPASARLEFSLLRDSQQVTLSFVPLEGV